MLTNAQLLEVPLMTPKSPLLSHQQHVLLMDATGTQFCLPYDSSTPFAYYLAREVFRHSGYLLY